MSGLEINVEGFGYYILGLAQTVEGFRMWG